MKSLKLVKFLSNWRTSDVVVTLSNYLHTLRYLKLTQLTNRVVFCLSKPRVDHTLAPALRVPYGLFTEPARRKISLVAPQTFCFLNQTRELSDVGWNNVGVGGDELSPSKLWRYNQHYFDDLNSFNASERVSWHEALLQEWVSEPAGLGVGWDPFPTSLRIINWIKWQLSGNILSPDCIQSLAEQVRWLNHRLERHILGNHFFSNGKALVFAGFFFDGQEAEQWLNKGLTIISTELKEQVLLDGAHFELSPMYHCIFSEDMLDLINVAQTFPHDISIEIVNGWKTKVAQMIRWTQSMTHPDGDIALFNDSAFGIACTPQQITEYAQRLSVYTPKCSWPISFTHLEDSGYIRIDDEVQALIIDVAKVGPDYLPGHAHADTLSFELSLFKERVFVNGGTSEYGSGNIRQQERGTTSHNTVVVDQQNSSEVWAGFRVARRAYPVDLQIKHLDGKSIISCSHNGYERLRKGLRHNRQWISSKNFLQINDAITGKFSEAFAYYHLSPDVLITSMKSSTVSLMTKKEKTILLDLFGTSFEVLDGFYSPEFGKRIPNKCLKVKLEKQKGASLRISWDQ